MLATSENESTRLTGLETSVQCCLVKGFIMPGGGYYCSLKQTEGCDGAKGLHGQCPLVPICKHAGLPSLLCLMGLHHTQSSLPRRSAALLGSPGRWMLSCLMRWRSGL